MIKCMGGIQAHLIHQIGKLGHTIAVFTIETPDLSVGTCCIVLARTFKMKQDPKHCFIPDHRQFLITEIRSKMKTKHSIRQQLEITCFHGHIKKQQFPSRIAQKQSKASSLFPL